MNNFLFTLLIWIPLDGAVPGSVTADYVKQAFPTEAACVLAKNQESRVFWNSKPGFRMLGTKECTDGSTPTSISIGQLTVIVETAEGNAGG